MDSPQIRPIGVKSSTVRCPGRCQGFTLVELIVVIVILSTLAVTVGMRWNAPSSTIPYQAELAARNLRHAQILAMNWGQTLQVQIVSPTNYRVRCANIASVTPPCNGAGAIMDPASNTGTFDVILASGITLTGPATLNFDRLGRPVNAGGVPLAVANAYTFSTGAVTYSARVNPITGFVTVQSP